MSGALGGDYINMTGGRDSDHGNIDSTQGYPQVGVALTMNNSVFGQEPNWGEVGTTGLKVFYGIGDGVGNLIENKQESYIYPIGESYDGDGLHPDSSGVYPTFFQAFRRYQKPRGWKYGLVNALPQLTQAVFRSDHFGQFRDMLEGRKFTVYVGTEDPEPSYWGPPVEVSFQLPTWQSSNPATVIPAEPVDTRSGNLSIYATSSLPFFDQTSLIGAKVIPSLPDAKPCKDGLSWPYGRDRPNFIDDTSSWSLVST
jgi:hypothetical protein